MSDWNWVSVPDLERGDVVASFGEVIGVATLDGEVFVWFEGDDTEDVDDAAKWDDDAMVQVRDPYDG